MRKTTILITAFAVIASFLMLSTSTAQQVVINVSGQMDKIEEYGQYKNSLNNFINELSSDSEIKNLLRKLKDNQEIKNILNQMNDLTLDDISDIENIDGSLGDALLDEIKASEDGAALWTLIEEDFAQRIEDLKVFTGLVGDELVETHQSTLAKELAEDINEKGKTTAQEDDFTSIVLNIIFACIGFGIGVVITLIAIALISIAAVVLSVAFIITAILAGIMWYYVRTAVSLLGAVILILLIIGFQIYWQLQLRTKIFVQPSNVLTRLPIFKKLNLFVLRALRSLGC
jgi:hypothetical protein